MPVATQPRPPMGATQPRPQPRRGSGIKIPWNKVISSPSARPIFHQGNQLLQVLSVDEGPSQTSKKLMYTVKFTVIQPEVDARKTCAMYYTLGSDADPNAFNDETILNSTGLPQLRWLLEKAGAKFGNPDLMATCKTILKKQVIGIFGPKTNREGKIEIQLTEIAGIGEREIGILKGEDTQEEMPSDEELDAAQAAAEGNGLDPEEGEGLEAEAPSEEELDAAQGEEEPEGEQEEAAEAETKECPMGCGLYFAVGPEMKAHVVSCDGTPAETAGEEIEEEEAPAPPPTTTRRTRPPTEETVTCPLCKTDIPRSKYAAHTKDCREKHRQPTAAVAAKAGGTKNGGKPATRRQ